MNPDEKAAEARLRAVAASHWRDVDAVDHNDALRVGDIRIMLALLDEARADYTAERERANEWLAQLHDSQRERDAATAAAREFRDVRWYEAVIHYGGHAIADDCATEVGAHAGAAKGGAK